MAERQAITDASIDKNNDKPKLRLSDLDIEMDRHLPDSKQDRTKLSSLEPKDIEFTNIFEEHLKKKNEWTVVVNLTATTPHTMGDTTAGSEHKLQQLMRLSAQTKDRPVTIVVQAIKDEDKDPAKPQTSAGPQDANTELERYVIRDGDIKYLSTTKSKGLGEDLKDILEIAEKDYPGKKLAMVQNSHGHGNDGVAGDNGKLSAKEMADTVSKVLKDSGRDKLSVLDLDACLMGEESVMQQLSKAAEHVVASVEPEGISGEDGIDGQNIHNIIESVLKNPYANGESLARELVQIAPKNSVKTKDEGIVSGNVTLAHYDLSKMPEFSKSLSSFADQLTTLCANAKDRQTLAQIIDEVPRVDGSGDLFETTGAEERDIKKFAEAIIRNSSKFSNGDALAKAAGELLNSQSSLVRNNYVQPDKKELQDTGGLSIFLPAEKYLDADQAADRRTPASMMMMVLNSVLKEPSNFLKPEAREMNSKVLGEMMQQLKQDLGDSATAQESMQEMEKALQELRQCDKPQSVRDTVCKLTTLTAALISSDAHEKLSDERYKPEMQKQIEKVVHKEMDASNPAWQRFLRTWTSSFAVA